MKPWYSLFDQSIQSVLGTGVQLLKEFPESRASLANVLAHLPKASRRRNTYRDKGVVVPPLLIVSTTKQCNLRCAGCYAQGGCHDEQGEMTKAQIDTLLSQAVDVGCCAILLAGGEPLMRMDWLEAVAAKPQLLGLVFTNGTLLNDTIADWFAIHRNLVPLISVEGDEKQTDDRRGQGVSAQIERAILLLSKRGIPFGLSITTGAHNVNDVAQKSFLQPYQKLGCRLCIYTEYVPVDGIGNLLPLTEESKVQLQTFCHAVSKEEDLLTIAFPGDETVFGGCLAAGRGFAHVNTAGDLEPCPFAAYSDKNTTDGTLLDALSSPLFARIRSESHLLHEGAGGCALRGKEALFLVENKQNDVGAII